MTWVRLDDGFAEHPKVLKLGPIALAIHVWALCYCARFLTDGFVPLEALAGCPWVSRRSARDRALGRLVSAGLWVAVEGGYRIHDYLSFNPDAASVQENRRQAADRQARWRERQREKRNAVTGSVTRNGRNALPDPTPKGGEGGAPNGAAPPLPLGDCAACGHEKPLVGERGLYCETCAPSQEAV